MTRPRATLVSPSDTPWYHVVSRCVRRAFLCGRDHATGRDFSHRRGWIETKVKELAAVFALDVAAYAIMSNHYHLVLRLAPERAASWTTQEVLRRWTSLFTGPQCVRRYLSAQHAGMDEAERAQAETLAQTYRARLADLSWFMRVLNESIARQANREDEATGRFWEGRFKCQALLDDAAILAAMSYVDLNPIRAGMADTPETSEHTSIAQRLRELADDAPPPEATAPQAPLLPFEATATFEPAIPFALEDYAELVDTLGRALHPKKRGRIPERAPRLLQRLGLDPEAFIAHADRLLKAFGQAVGAPASLAAHCAARQTRFLRGMRTARAVFERPAEQDRRAA
jgi:REP element-mobilizing transposase RayT